MTLIAALVPFLLFVRLVVNHGARATFLAPLFAVWLIIVFSLVATPFVAAAAGAAVGAGTGFLVLTALSRVTGAAYVAALVFALVPPFAALSARSAVAHGLERASCVNDGKYWDPEVDECREQRPAQHAARVR